MTPFPEEYFRLIGFNIFENLSLNWTWRSEIKRFLKLWVGIRGSGQMTVNGTRRSFSPGTAFVLNQGDIIVAQQESDERIANLAINFRMDGINTGLTVDELMRPIQGIAIRDFAMFERLAFYGSRLARDNDPLTQQQKRGIAIQLITTVWRDSQESSRDPLIVRMESLMRRIERESYASFNVDTMAEFCGLSRSHFSRRFQAHTGFSPNAYLINTRISRARSLLRNSSTPIEQIARELGYRDVYFFSRQFKQRIGQSPLAYRKS